MTKKLILGIHFWKIYRASAGLKDLQRHACCGCSANASGMQELRDALEATNRKAPPLSLVLRLSLSAIWWPVSIPQGPLQEALWLGSHAVEGKKGTFLLEDLVPGEGKSVRGRGIAGLLGL